MHCSSLQLDCRQLHTSTLITTDAVVSVVEREFYYSSGWLFAGRWTGTHRQIARLSRPWPGDMGVRRLDAVHAALGCTHRGCAGAAAQPDQGGPTLPHVVVIGTGGTIAGSQRKEDAGTLGSYRAGTLAVGSLVTGLPQSELARHATVDHEQFLNIASPGITPAHWLALSRRINAILNDDSASPRVDGIVVTHGTDRLEETAFFLYLTVASSRPVVICGAQRPATGLSPDGPINLLSAIRVAASPQSIGMGAVVVMDDRIMSARECRKLYPRSGGFGVGDMGMLGGTRCRSSSQSFSLNTARFFRREPRMLVF
jgi:L-asparaginase/Glu-tRNA(Gln) amidotransferase subunit D